MNMKKILTLLLLLMPIMAYAQFFNFTASKMAIEHLAHNEWVPVYHSDSCNVSLETNAVDLMIKEGKTTSVYHIIYAYEEFVKANDYTSMLMNCREKNGEKCIVVYYKYKSGYQEVHIDFADRRLRYWLY